MSITVSGVVKDGLIVLSEPLPEGGARVEIVVAEFPLDVPEVLQAEFEEWDRAGADALALVEANRASDAS